MANMNKSGLTPADLEKGLRALEAASTAGAAGNQELLKKAADGSITEEEKDELIKSLSGDSLADKATKGLTGNDTIRKSVDVSDYLREQHYGMVAGLEVLASHMEKSQAVDHEFRKALATTVVQVASLVKSQAEEIAELRKSLDTWGAQPARAPKSPQTPTLAKSFAGGQSADSISKSQIEDAFSSMLEKGMESIGGEELIKAATKYEVSGFISPPVLAEVKQFITNTHKAG